MSVGRRLTLAVVFGLAYCLAAWLGVVALIPNSISPWWPAAGVAWAGLVLLGWRYWPIIVIATFAFHFSRGLTHRPLYVGWLGFIASTEALVGYWLIQRWKDFRPSLQRLRDVGILAAVAGMASAFAAMLGVPSFSWMGLVEGQPLVEVSIRWWLGTMTGKLVIGALAFAWADSIPSKQHHSLDWLELSGLVIVAFGLSSIVFGTSSGVSSPYWLFPVMTWAALRQSSRGATIVAAAVALTAMAWIVHGQGPFAHYGRADGTLRLQIYVGVLASTGLLMAAAFAERSQAYRERDAQEVLFQSMLEHGEETYCLFDPAGRVTFATSNCVRVLGYSAEQFTGMVLFDLIHADDRERIQSIFADLTTQPNQAATAATRMRCADNQYRWIEGTGMNLLDDPRVGAIVANFRDVSARMQSLEALRASETSLAAAQRVAGVGSWERDLVSLNHLDNNPLRWSDETFRIFGYRPKSINVTGDLFYQAVHPDDRAMVQSAMSRALKSGSDYAIEHRILRPDGTERNVYERCDVIQDAAGQAIKLLGTVQDITDRKQAEARLIVQDERIRLLVKASPIAVIVYDRDGNVRVWNQAAENTLGWSADITVGQPHPLATPDQPGSWSELQAKALSGVSVTGRELKCLRRDGKAVWANVSVAPLRDATGAITGALWLLADVTEQRHLREQLAQSQKMESIGRLAGGIAHDFNNLLTVINGYSDLSLERLPETDPTRELIREIRRAGQRAAGLTSQLLAFSRKSLVAPVPLNLNSVMAELQKMLRRLIGEDVELTTILDPAVGPVCVDPTQMEQVLLNLAVNARDAMPAGGHLVIETKNVELDRPYSDANAEVAPGRYVLLAVTDNGLGMTAEVRDRIFEPFFTTKELGQGTGLGLATVYGIVKQNQGHIAVYSEVGRGTTFKIYLPRVDGPVDDESLTLSPTMPLNGGRETILLVEDEDGVRKFARMILESAGYRVLEARDGMAAQELVRTAQGAIHLLLTDVVMPRISGQELAKNLREQRPELRVVFMSGYTDHVMFREGVIENGDPFLQKPFTAGGLLEIVREALDQAAKC